MNGYFALKARGSGRTSRQIAGAPVNAVYVVWSTKEFSYTRALMARLHRNDMELVSFAWIEHERYRGDRRHVVVDHYAERMAKYMIRSREWRQLNELDAYQGRDYSFDPDPKPPLPPWHVSKIDMTSPEDWL